MPTAVAIEEISFDLNELTISALRSGDHNGKLLLCLHGWLDNAASFLPLIPHLQDYHILAIDWPGHGQSTHRSNGAHYHFIDWTYDLLQLFELNQWQQIDIVAHSMGAMVASAFAAAFPEKVKSLTLLDSVGLLSTDPEESTAQLRKGMLSRLKGKNKQKSVHSSLNSAIEARMLVSDLNENNAKLIVERGLSKAGDGFMWRADSRLRSVSPYRLTLPQAQQLIRDIKAPVQLVHGNNGMDLVQSGIKHFGPLFDNFECHELTGGHHVHMEKPEQTAELILQFLQT